MKTLAIKGDKERGNEVIALLEMLGGNNVHNLYGDENYAYYVIEGVDNEIRGGIYIFGDENLRVFTLDEFYEKYPYKIGDRVLIPEYESEVRICDMDWSYEDIQYLVYRNDDAEWYTADELKNWNDNFYGAETKVELTGYMQLDKTVAVIFNEANYEDEVELKLGDYEIEVRDGKTYAVLKKPKYPTTYEECFNIHTTHNTLSLLANKTDALYNLLICRNAYWKIAGEEMGLGKPWEPKFGKYIHYSINFYLYQDSFVLHKGEYNSSDNRILVFPTEEMRDAFYENFKDLIEQCKELL